MDGGGDARKFGGRVLISAARPRDSGGLLAQGHDDAG
jgi:hypothetical protein